MSSSEETFIAEISCPRCSFQKARLVNKIEKTSRYNLKGRFSGFDSQIVTYIVCPNCSASTHFNTYLTRLFVRKNILGIKVTGQTEKTVIISCKYSEAKKIFDQAQEILSEISIPIKLDIIVDDELHSTTCPVCGGENYYRVGFHLICADHPQNNEIHVNFFSYLNTLLKKRGFIIDGLLDHYFEYWHYSVVQESRFRRAELVIYIKDPGMVLVMEINPIAFDRKSYQRVVDSCIKSTGHQPPYVEANTYEYRKTQYQEFVDAISEIKKHLPDDPKRGIELFIREFSEN